MKPYIYADNAATTKIDTEALEAMLPWLSEEYGNASQPYSFAKKPKEALRHAREVIASCINADPEYIFFTSGGTESDNWTIKCFGNKNEKRLLVTSCIEHHAILNAATDADNLISEFVSVNVQGEVDVDELEKKLRENVHRISSTSYPLVSVMYGNNEIGTIQPIKTITETAHRHGAICHTDAVQAVGHVPIDVKELGIDLLSASAHKFNGPKGIGFLYDRGGYLSSFNSGGGQEKGRRAGTENIASIVGMAVALENNCRQLEKNRNHIQALDDYLMEMLSQSKIEFKRNGSINHIPGIISLSFPDADGEMILHRLDLMGIAISTGAACDSVHTQVSHVLKAIKLPKRYAEGTIRISLGKYNTIGDCKTIANALVKVIGSTI